MNELTQVQAELFEEVAMEMDLEVRWSYEGRGMYGRKCIGVVGDEFNGIKFAVELLRVKETWAGSDEHQNAADELLEALADARLSSDNMGRSGIWYWSSVGLADGVEMADTDNDW